MAEDFNSMRSMTRRLVKTEFRQKWQWKIKFDQGPQDFELYVKDITFGPTEITSEAVKVGAMTLTYVEGASPCTISLTMREHTDKRISKWFDDWAGKAVNTNGTVGLPYGSNGYVRKVKLYFVNENGTEELDDEWEVIPGQRGDVTLSYEDPGHMEFPVTFTQFCSTGAKLNGGSSGISGGLSSLLNNF